MKKNWRKIVLICVLVVVIGIVYYSFFLGPTLKFREQEEQLLEAGKSYFERNSYLLSSNGIREVSLSTLYDQKYLDTLYVPNSKKICSGKESFVKVKKQDEEMDYVAYLSCGKYHSTTDHEGPKITLNGDSTVTISKGETYQEKGIKSVKDAQDGVMKTEDVTIDSSKVDTKQVGTYEVTYTAYDKWNNKTTVTRTVRVVQKLADIVKEDTEGKGYYQGEIGNNYLTLNAMLWRIVGLEKDGSITIVLDEPVANVDYSLAKGNKVKGSSMDKWLNDYFYSKLDDEAKDLIVKNSSWCTDAISKDNLNTTECKNTTKMTVGLASIQDYNRSLLQNSTYLSAKNIVSWMLNPNTVSGSAWAERSNFIYDENTFFKSYDEEIAFGVKPAVRLKKDVEIYSGNGSSLYPYYLGDLYVVDRNDPLNTRIAGEYVTYSGYLFRIVDVEKDGTTHVIQDGVLTVDASPVLADYSSDGAKIYNPNKKGNVGNLIANEMTQYIQTEYFAKKEVTVPIYKKRALYQKEDDTKTYTVKLAAPNLFDLFSARRGDSTMKGYWFINSSKDSAYKYLTGAVGTVYYTENIDSSNTGVKISAYFDKDVKIRDGEGTVDSPYRLTK